MGKTPDNLGTEPRIPYEAKCSRCGLIIFGAAPANAIAILCPQCKRFAPLRPLPDAEAAHE